jgi:uncharacterized protein (DUF1810 family)
VELILACSSKNITEILGHPDDLKLRSCLTLFARAMPDEPIFQIALDRFYDGQHDELTINLIQKHGAR